MKGVHNFFAAFAALLLALWPGPAKAACEPMVLYADRDAEEPVREAARRFSIEAACSVTLEFADTPALARRISEGGLAHLFLSAGQDWTTWLENRGHINGSNRHPLLRRQEHSYELAMLGPAPHRDTRRLYAFLQSYDAAEIFVRHGFFRRE